MKQTIMKLLSLLLASLMVLSSFVACGVSDEKKPDDQGEESADEGVTEIATADEAAAALEDLGEID